MIAFTSQVQENCPHDRAKRFGKTKSGEQRYRCLDCGKTFVESTRTLDGMTIGTDKAAQIVSCIMEGVGIRGTARLAGVANNTVMDLLYLVGQRCKMFMDDTLVNVPVKDVQADEIWSFVYCKEKARKRLSLPVSGFGDKYCFVGFERHNKLALAWQLGERDYNTGKEFVLKLARACGNHDFQITTDGWRSYRKLVPAFLHSADFATLIKVYARGDDTGRYSPGQIIDTKLKPIAGEPDPDRACTSHVERHNLTMRMEMRRFTRLTNGFSKKLENHESALGLYFAAYNFCQKHGAIKATPAQAAGLTLDRWTVADLIERTSDYKLPKPPTDWERFIDSLPDDE